MGVGTRVRNSFVTGLVLLAPLAITAFVVQFVVVRVSRALDPFVSATQLTAYTANIEVVAQVLAAVLVVVAITLAGDLASHSVGIRAFEGLERAVRLVPLVRSIYFGVQQVGESLIERSAGYESVVLVEYPREGIYSIGFVTNDSPRNARLTAGEDLYNVFLPHSPNPTAGSLIMAPAAEIHEVDISVGRGLRLLVTTGLGVDDIEDLPEEVTR